MTWDLVDAGATALVGIVGIGATLLAQRSERKHSARLSAADRTQSRRQAAYERLLVQAIEVTEFVGFADVIFIRNFEPPDVDVKSYDAWLLLDLYTSKEFRAKYWEWRRTVEAARDILDEVPTKKRWYTVKGDLPDRFRAAKERMDSALDDLKAQARFELMSE